MVWETKIRRTEGSCGITKGDTEGVQECDDCECSLEGKGGGGQKREKLNWKGENSDYYLTTFR